MTLDYAKLCGICAWREGCRKKFSLSHDALHCSDYSKDVTIKDRPEKAEEKEKK
ncbi:MAG: hypothetical protein Q7T53_11520 [Deltaproteobacteria bacterium]|nr:hypothetical protein [Deltaproteobacteria bacterium]